MALFFISGNSASRYEEVARATARLLEFELVDETRLSQWIAEEFGDASMAGRTWKHAALFVLGRMAAAHHLVISVPGLDILFPPGGVPVLRARIVAPEASRIGNLLIDRRLDRAAAKDELAKLDRDAKQLHKKRFGKGSCADGFDVILSGEQFDPAHLADILRAIAVERGMREQGFLAQEGSERFQFEASLALAKHGIVPAGQAQLTRADFNHPSEKIFASLLDFYRIAWEYEPRSFPLQWDKDGKVTEAFTPDFYLPEFDLYVELTTMKQSLVTKKNRKVKLLRAIYPHVNIQVFYQKDFQNLVFKHGLQLPPKDFPA